MVSSSSLSRPRTPVRSPAPEDLTPPPIPGSELRGREPAQRRPSFSFLRRGKSQERSNSVRSISGGKLTKRQVKEAKLQAQRDAAAVPNQPPRIPDLQRTPQLQTFGGENAQRASYGRAAIPVGGYSRPRPLPTGSVGTMKANSPYQVPVPPVPKDRNGEDVDPYARTESMTHRGRYSYASSAISTINNPRRIRRRKDPTPFNILIVGARNSGKTSLLEFLRTSLALPTRKQRSQSRADSFSGPVYTHIYPNYTSHYIETEMDDGERIGLTLWDSEGLDKNMVDLQLREMSSFLESKFEDTFNEEMKVVRSPGVQDTHIHCVFLVLDPSRLDGNMTVAQKARDTANGTLFAKGNSFLQDADPGIPNALDEDLDLQVLRTLQGKTTVVPVISKADTVTTTHMAQLKRAVWDSIKRANLDPLEALGLDDGEDDADSEEEQQQMVMRNHRKHNSRYLDERDEDSILHDKDQNRNGNGKGNYIREPLLRLTSHLDDPSSSSGDSSPTRRTQPQPQLGATSIISPLNPAPITATVTNNMTATAMPYLPLSIISPDVHDPGVIGRKFPWGFADPYNLEHCDFVRLREAVFKEWRGELKEASREFWYERWRTSRLNGRGRTAPEEEVGRAR